MKRCKDCKWILNKPYSSFCAWASWIEAGWTADKCAKYQRKWWKVWAEK